MKMLLPLFIFASISCTQAQDVMTEELPYSQIPDYPEDYSPGNVIARMIDGLGYRYYWATEGLTEKDLNFSPSSDARNAFSTLKHIHGLSETILNAPLQQANIRPTDRPELTFEELRRETLLNLKKASDLLRGKSKEDIAEYPIVFQRGERKSEFPFWNMLNGPLADALYHTGQIVSFRRSSGNPMDPNVNVFLWKNRDD